MAFAVSIMIDCNDGSERKRAASLTFHHLAQSARCIVSWHSAGLARHTDPDDEARSAIVYIYMHMQMAFGPWGSLFDRRTVPSVTPVFDPPDGIHQPCCDTASAHAFP